VGIEHFALQYVESQRVREHGWLSLYCGAATVARSVYVGTVEDARPIQLSAWPIEFCVQVPEAQGFWPADWLLGNNIGTINWPACGEQDVIERVNAAGTPDWNEGSIHGAGFTGATGLGTAY
jgi:hypothetical protein